MMGVTSLAQHHVPEDLGDGISASRREIQQWLIQEDAKAAAIEYGRFRTIRFWAVVGGVTGALAAIAAWIAAWPIIKSWLWLEARRGQGGGGRLVD